MHGFRSNDQYVLGSGRQHRYVGAHAAAQVKRHLERQDVHHVSCYVINRFGFVGDVVHFARNDVLRVGIHGEVSPLAEREPSNIRLVHRGFDNEPVRHDVESVRGRYRLPPFDIAGDDVAIQGSDQRGGLVKLLPVGQLVGALGERCIQQGRPFRGTHPCQNLAGVNFVAFLDQDLLNTTGDGRFKFQAILGFNRAGGQNKGLQIVALDEDFLVCRFFSGSFLPEQEGARNPQPDEHYYNPEQFSTHHGMTPVPSAFSQAAWVTTASSWLASTTFCLSMRSFSIRSQSSNESKPFWYWARAISERISAAFRNSICTPVCSTAFCHAVNRVSNVAAIWFSVSA